MKRIEKVNAIAALYIMAATLAFASCGTDSGTSNLQAKVDSLQNELKKFTDERTNTELRLAKFDSLDFLGGHRLGLRKN